nr:endoplasmic reticulum aminopeptidase 1-like [Chelonoidis abingdonii]
MSNIFFQWFGNLVTMEWWNDLWLNEGFAKFMEYVSVSITHPDLKVEDYFLGKCFDAMEVDALNSSHPVSTPVEDPAQIQEMFDDVSYEKGACILNMLRDYLNADVFKAGLVQYLQKYSYQNTKNEDLWNSLAHASISWRAGVTGLVKETPLGLSLDVLKLPLSQFSLPFQNPILLNQTCYFLKHRPRV